MKKNRMKRAVIGFFVFVISIALLVLPFVFLYISGELKQMPYFFIFALYYLLVGYFGAKAVVSILKEVIYKNSNEVHSRTVNTTLQVNSVEPIKDEVVYFNKISDLKIETNYEDLDLSVKEKLEKLLGNQKKIHSQRTVHFKDVLFGVNLSKSKVQVTANEGKKLCLEFVHSINTSEALYNGFSSFSDDYKRDEKSVSPEYEKLTVREIEELNRLHQKKQEETFAEIMENAIPSLEESVKKQFFPEDDKIKFVRDFGKFNLLPKNIYSLSDYLSISSYGENPASDYEESSVSVRQSLLEKR